MLGLWLVILGGLLSIVYGIVTTSQLMAADTGNARMQEIAGAIAEGAQAYLRRQYLTIAGVGVVIFVILGFLLSWPVAIGFLIGAVLSGMAGFIGMNVSVRANVRTAQGCLAVAGTRPRDLVQGGRHHRHAGRRIGPARRRRLLHDPDRADGSRALQPRSHRCAGRAGLRRLADLDLRATRGRHFHQGRRLSAPISSARSKRAFPRTIRAIPPP